MQEINKNSVQKTSVWLNRVCQAEGLLPRMCICIYLCAYAYLYVHIDVLIDIWQAGGDGNQISSSTDIASHLLRIYIHVLTVVESSRKTKERATPDNLHPLWKWAGQNQGLQVELQTEKQTSNFWRGEGWNAWILVQWCRLCKHQGVNQKIVHNKRLHCLCIADHISIFSSEIH